MSKKYPSPFLATLLSSDSWMLVKENHEQVASDEPLWEWNASAIVCPWTVRHATALICVLLHIYIYIYIYIISILNIYTLYLYIKYV